MKTWLAKLNRLPAILALPVLVAVLFVPFNSDSSASAQGVPKSKPPQRVAGKTISTLVRSTMIALNHANITGNYTVLRDLGSSDFRSENTAARLSEIFRAFRDANISLADTVLLDPRLVGSPSLTKTGELRLKGLFLTQPENVTFDLTYFFESGNWRIANLTIGFHTHQEQAAAAARRRDAEASDSQ